MAATVRAEPQEVAILDLQPDLRDSLLVCRLHIRGLPTPPMRETLESGLPSAVVVALTLSNGEGNERGGGAIEVRVEPDLWEQEFLLQTPLMEERLETLEEVADRLSRLGPLPVAAADRLGMMGTLRIGARLAVHPLAPAETERMESVLAGDAAEEPDQKEISIGLGALVRLFWGGSPGDEWIADFQSAPFTLARLRKNAPALEPSRP
ncbi:MAG: hypothetical protein GF355_13575 [Candidatus Eisenbacteria bacterium]|nr:hypothetical protein [Candidatus Eisenbacteria bacterium]